MNSLQKNKTFPKKPALIGAVCIGVLTLASAIYVYGFNGNLFGWTNGQEKKDTAGINSKATDEQKKAGDRKKQETGSSNDGKGASSNENDQSTASDPQANSTSRVDVVITVKNQTTNTLQIRSLISSVQSQGQCTLTLEHADRQPVVKTSSVQAQPNSSTCQGFDVPLYELVPGLWTITLDYKNGNISGQATSTITIT